MPLKIAVVCEALADYRTATALAERVFFEVDWVDADLLRDCPLWWGQNQRTPYILWTEIKELAGQLGLRKTPGHFGGQPAQADAHIARRALFLLQRLHPDLDGVLLIRDDDRQTERRAGLEQARSASALGDRVVIGLAHCKRECWVLAGFDPVAEDEAEQVLLTEIRQEIGFDPRLNAERLTAKHDQDKLSAKRVLAVLTRNDRDREEFCWKVASLVTLSQRGVESGLADFLRELKDRLLPLFTGHPSR